MTPSIIRRFARYHSIQLALDDDNTQWSIEDIAIALHGNLATPNVLKVVQSLTRIEDAELIMKATHPMPSTLWGQGFASANESAHQGFLRLAAIDPDKWREVKDEET